VFLVKHVHHGLLIDSHHRAICHCGCRPHAEKLPRKAIFSEEIAFVQNAYRGFFPAFATTVNFVFIQVSAAPKLIPLS